MTGPAVIQVHPLSEVRQRLSGILARFRREGAAAEPVAFGSHRKPEPILLPYEVYERYVELSRQHARLDSALDAEREITHAALILLHESPISPSYDLAHLREIHKRIFGDIYVGQAGPDGGHGQGRHILPPAVHRFLRGHHLPRAA
jgi:hypothetical protein